MECVMLAHCVVIIIFELSGFQMKYPKVYRIRNVYIMFLSITNNNYNRIPCKCYNNYYSLYYII